MALRFLLGLALVQVSSAQTTGCAEVKAPSAWFTFEEPMFQKRGTDAPAVIPGMVGMALRFDGKQQYSEIPAGTPGLDVGEGNFSVELWIRTKNAKGTVNVVDKRNAIPHGYLIFVHQGHPGFQLAYGEHGSIWRQEVSIADGRWHHLAASIRRFPPDLIRLYVDGVERAASANPGAFGNLDVSEPLWLGRHHRNGRVAREDIYFEGDLDELAIYRRALTPAEIVAIYRAGSRGKCRPRK